MPQDDPTGAPPDDELRGEADAEGIRPGQDEEPSDTLEAGEELSLAPGDAETPTETPDAEEGAEDAVAVENDAPEADAEAEGEDLELAEEEGDEEDADTIEAAEAEDPKQWYVLKVQSNREDSIREAILRRVKMAGLEESLGEIVVPTEKITEIKGGKKRVTERKFFPGYVMVHADLNHDIWFVIRETAGVGDFVGANNQPVPMTPQDVDRMLGREAAVEETQPRLKINFEKGDRVKIKEGTFENFEGDVEEVIEGKGLVRVMIQIFGRPTPVELEYWQVEPV